jgi:ATP-dependent Clp protease adaptor protein ClpS
MAQNDVEDAVDASAEEELKHPEEYFVILLNDDYTTMEFVVMVLMTVFHRDFKDATRIMLNVHERGRGVVGSYAYDIAVTKVNAVHALAREAGFPLKCVIERL